QSVIDKGRLAHAYLFYGPRGVGKSKTAHAFASTLNCAQACGTCISCRGVQARTHPDFIYIEPQGAQGILLDQIKTLIKRVKLKAHAGNYRVIIIDEAHKLLPEAANALLKTLEEPPERVVFILVAHDMSRVLSTISSRCQRVRFGALGNEVARDILIKDHKVSKDKAELAVALSGGIIGEALEMAASGLLNVRNDMAGVLLSKTPSTARSAALAAKLVAVAKKQTLKVKKAQDAELAEALSMVEGSKSISGFKRDLAARHHRERARLEQQCFRQSLALVASIYRDTLVISENGDDKFLANRDLIMELKDAEITRSAMRSALADISESERLDGIAADFSRDPTGTAVIAKARE
ncbi:hypothetical protein LCGC14_3065970, partial [marine sediment metagenome]